MLFIRSILGGFADFAPYKEQTMDIWTLGEAVRKARQEMGLTQKDLATRAEVSRGRVEGLENERLGDIGLMTLVKILEILQLDLALTTLNRQRPTLDDLQR
jgi:transcriptional regulator with XRE-family HTH domain